MKKAKVFLNGLEPVEAYVREDGRKRDGLFACPYFTEEQLLPLRDKGYTKVFAQENIAPIPFEVKGVGTLFAFGNRYLAWDIYEENN